MASNQNPPTSNPQVHPPIPTVTSELAPDVRRFVDRVRETLADGTGVTVADLVDTGLFELNNGGLDPVEDFSLLACVSPPPEPVDLEAEGAFENIILVWGGIDYGASKCYSHTEVWRGLDDLLTEATEIAISSGRMYSDPVGPGQKYYYWVRMVDAAGEKSGFNSLAGTYGETAPDLEYIMEILSEDYALGTEDTPFFHVPDGTTLDLEGGAEDGGITLQPGIYIKTAFIHEAAIQSAQIGSLAADKIFAAEGSIAHAIIEDGDISNLMIGNFIQSNDWEGQTGGSGTWRIDKNGDCIFRGIRIYDDYGNLLLSSGDGMNVGTLGLGEFAFLNEIDASNISTYIADAAISNAYIGQVIQSADFLPFDADGGPRGWQLDKGTGANDSTLTIKNGTFYGNLKVTGDSYDSGSYLDMTNDVIKVIVDGVTRVQIGDLTL